MCPFVGKKVSQNFKKDDKVSNKTGYKKKLAKEKRREREKKIGNRFPISQILAYSYGRKTIWCLITSNLQKIMSLVLEIYF